MARPADVTEERMAAWLAKAGPLNDWGIIKPTPEMEADSREVVYAGYWLEEKLRAETEADEETISAGTQSFGQICLGRDPWEVAPLFLKLYKGTKQMLPPGPELSKALLDGDLDDLFGVGASGGSPEGIYRMLKALDISNKEDLLARVGASSIEEALVKLKIEIAEAEEGFKK